jgi:hypothetical protein
MVKKIKGFIARQAPGAQPTKKTKTAAHMPTELGLIYLGL